MRRLRLGEATASVRVSPPPPPSLTGTPVAARQIIQHTVFHIDADGNVRVDRTFEKIGDC